MASAEIECPVCGEELDLETQSRHLQVVDGKHVVTLSLTPDAERHLADH